MENTERWMLGVGISPTVNCFVICSYLRQWRAKKRDDTKGKGLLLSLLVSDMDFPNYRRHFNDLNHSKKILDFLSFNPSQTYMHTAYITFA